LIFILISVEYTSARNPSDYCNGIKSPALPLSVDEKGNILFYLIAQQRPYFQSDINDPPASSSSAGQPMLDIDLN